ncbi:restriction endonuclease subunit S [[Pasteurella] aerogenes]
MNNEKRLVPKLRFPEFTHAWEQRKAKEIFISISEKGFSNLPVLSASQEFGMIRRDEIGIDIKYDQKSIQTYKRVTPGQFVIHLRSFQGGFAWSDIEGIASPAYTIIDFKKKEKHFSNFWKLIFTSSSFIKKLETVTYGIRDGRSISFSDFSDLKLFYPQIQEQQKIGAFFTALDRYITIHQRKLENVKKLKAGLLQKMFPKNDQEFPEIRFPEFTYAWEQRKLEDFGLATGGTSLEDEFSDDGEYKVISIGSYSENSTYTDQGIRINKTEKSKSRILNKNDLTMILNDKTSSGNIIGRVLLIDQDDTYIYNQRTQRIETNLDLFDAQFLYQLLNADHIRKKIIFMAQGNTQIYVNWSNIKNISYLIPTGIQEQQKIGAFFTALDRYITIHQRKLENMQKLKKSLLQQMFV